MLVSCVISEEPPLAIIITGAAGGVVLIAACIIAYLLYQRCRHSDNGKITCGFTKNPG